MNQVILKQPRVEKTEDLDSGFILFHSDVTQKNQFSQISIVSILPSSTRPRTNRISFRQFFIEQKASLVLAYLVIGQALNCWAVSYYFRLDVHVTCPIVLGGFILGIYLLNWVAEAKADFINNPTRAGIVKNGSLYLGAAIGSLAFSMAIAGYYNRLHWSLFLLIAIGVMYSYELMPWYSKTKGLVFKRLKDLTGIKSLTVAITSAAYVYGLPFLFNNSNFQPDFKVYCLIIGLAFTNFISTVYDDLLDIPGDIIEGVKTIPVVLGEKGCTLLLTALIIGWTTAVTTFFIQNRINGQYAIVLGVQALYPLSWIVVHRLIPRLRFCLDFMIDSVDVLSLIGLIYLALNR